MDWTTGNELDFIAGLGMFAEHSLPIERAELLRGYLAGAEVRAAWGGMDRKRILAFAREERALCDTAANAGNPASDEPAQGEDRPGLEKPEYGESEQNDIEDTSAGSPWPVEHVNEL